MRIGRMRTPLTQPLRAANRMPSDEKLKPVTGPTLTMVVHGIADYAEEIPEEAKQMPVDGEQLPVLFHGLYHEKQIGSLCAVHALNNLVQRRAFDEVGLASVAGELDAAERALGIEPANVRVDGFFSVQVIVAALQNSGLTCATAHTVTDPARETGFIFNRREHWFALRRLNNEWFDLNSLFAAPQHMSPTHLALFFEAQANQGYSIYVVRGRFPSTPLADDPRALALAVRACKTYTTDGPPQEKDKEEEDPAFAAFTGAGNRLQQQQIDPDLQQAADADPDLAAAIAMSLDNAPSRTAKDDADEIRRKRLARFG